LQLESRAPSSSLKLVEDILGIIELLRLNLYAFLLNLLQDGQQILLDLLLNSLLQLLLHLLAIFEPLELLVGALDDLVTYDCLHSLINGCLQGCDVDLFGTEKLKQGFLLL